MSTKIMAAAQRRLSASKEVKGNPDILDIMNQYFDYADAHEGDRYDGYISIGSLADDGGIAVTPDFANFGAKTAKTAKNALEEAGYTVESMRLTIGDKEPDRRVLFYKFKITE